MWKSQDWSLLRLIVSYQWMLPNNYDEKNQLNHCQQIKLMLFDMIS